MVLKNIRYFVGRKKKENSMSSGLGKLVCVTGASGYIASWIVNFLLQRGYTVRATVRDPTNPKKTQHLVNLDGAKERLQIFKADLLQEGSFDSAIQGCDGVCNTASPVPPPAANIQNPRVEVIEQVVKGTLNVLKSCAKSPTVKRIILTSSMAASIYNGRPLSPEVEIDETWFSNPDFCLETKLKEKRYLEEMARRYEGHAIGIDLGTTYSCVAVWQEHHFRVEIIHNDQGNRTTPSCVAFADTQRLIGVAAKNHATINPANTIFDAKRLIGRKFSDLVLHKDMMFWPFKVIANTHDKLVIVVTYKGAEDQKSCQSLDLNQASFLLKVCETRRDVFLA
ncbi:unnamed protein product [Lupinus luteus]|uniref:NAD(P)-binding domain-containing protein n=1 Tax=Lupinus luteus TaxID=3873 RepID=A0AAV1YEW8_LUPLU